MQNSTQHVNKTDWFLLAGSVIQRCQSQTSLEVFSKTQLNARLAIRQRADFFGANISESGLRFREVGKGTIPCFFSFRKLCSYVRHLKVIMLPLNQNQCVDFIYVLRSRNGKRVSRSSILSSSHSSGSQLKLKAIYQVSRL